MYLKIVLTIIALCLIIRCTVDLLPGIAQADSITQVDIVKVNGRALVYWSVPVTID